MVQTLTINVDTTIASANVVENTEISPLESEETQAGLEATDKERENLALSALALEEASNKLKQFREEIFSSHREQIARLSVEIARRILQKEISEGQYEIEKIIQELLKTVPSQQNITIRLNPVDLQQYEQIAKDKNVNIPSDIKLVADPTIGPAQCIVETDKEMVENLIDEHLIQIAEALKSEDE